jgi:CRP-like cAMP-binding protein
VHSAVKNRHNRERHYGFACRSYKYQLELDLRYTQSDLPALRSKHDGISLSRILSQRLASGVGAGDLRWIEE